MALKNNLQRHFKAVQVLDKSDKWLMQIIRKLSTHIQHEIISMPLNTPRALFLALERGVDKTLNLIEQHLIPYVNALGLNQLYLLDANTLSSLAYVCSFAMDFEPSETKTELLSKAQLLDGISFAQKKQTFINSLKHQKPNSMTDFGEFRNDIDVMMAAVQLNGCAINGASDELKNNEGLVEAALKNDGFAFQFAPNHLKANKRLVLLACENDGLALQFASGGLVDDRDCVLAAVHNNGLTLEFAPDALKADLEIVKAALTQNQNAYIFVHDSIKQHHEIYALAFPANV